MTHATGAGPLVLLVDDDPAVLRGVGGLLRDEGFRTRAASSGAEAFAALERETPALVLLDLAMPGETGLQFLERLPRPLPAPVVVLSGEARPADAVAALKLGATDFVEKPPSAERLLTAVQNALRLHELHEERERLLRELQQPHGLVGESAPMAELRRRIARAAQSDAAVLIAGETGSGKERVARALHAASGRKGRLVAVNCAALPASLLESELFGHERGAFTGATARRAGRIEQAHGGALLLDELGELPLELQAKLLRVLETREVERLGGSAPVKVDVRVLAATHRNLEEMVRAGRFREDLFYRLNVLRIEVPALRDRPADVLPLLRAFLAEIAPSAPAPEVADDAAVALATYAWPGNVRELRNFAERAALLTADDRAQPLRLDAAAVQALLGGAPRGGQGDALAGLGHQGYRELVDGFERKVIQAALDRVGGNVAGAARLLRIDRGNLWRRMKALGMSE